MNVFFFGLGFSALAAASAIRDRHPDAVMSGTSRTAAGAEALKARGIDGFVFDGTHSGPGLVQALGVATHIIHSIPPDAAGDPALRVHRETLDATSGLKWIGYYSTVGVYGGSGGEWVDETTQPAPRNARSEQRVAAENAWRDYGAGRSVPVAVLRLAGIYGPGRSAFDKLRDGTARRIVKPGQVFNRIHVADIATITALAASQCLAGTYNLADDEPAPPQDLISYAARRLGMTPPPDIPFETAELTPMQRSFYADNKRVSNAAIKSALGITLAYPNYRVGLDAIFKGSS